MSEQRHLYFMLNPFTGLVKIGIATDVEHRKYTLECAAGVDLVLLGTLGSGERYERDLHAAFAESRQRGEWFLPSDDLLALAESPTSVPAFLVRVEPRIEAARLAEEQRKTEQRLRREADVAAEKEALRQAEETRRAAAKALKAKREAERRKRETAARERQAREAIEREAQIRQYHERQAAWLERTGLRPKVAADEAAERLEQIKRRRQQNMQLLGIRC